MSDTHVNAKKYEFKAEIKQLLDILVHSLYTSREIFLRELISNASDALDKLRFESTRGTEIIDGELPLDISITFDEKNNAVTIKDSGIGMTADELIANIGTIAKSGSSEFIKQLAESKSDVNNIIGKFGVGFYSVFMVANEVVIKTRSFKKEFPAVEWRSNGLGDYEITELEGEIKRGTIIEIRLKDDAKEFANKYRLESVIKKHSNFISFPIYLENEKVNTIAAIWREPKSNIKKEQYDEFYKYLSYDSDEPLDTLHISIDAPIQFNSLLFIPKKNMDVFGYNRENYGLDLYVRRVLINHKNKDLLPEYLGFVKGVVDSEDLPLNISRETLQENVVFTKISNHITTQLLSRLIKLAKDEPEKYKELWKEHSRVFKMGYSDFANLEKFSELLRFNSSVSSSAEELISLEDYTKRFKEGQNEIYFAVGTSRDALNLDPHLEIFKSKGLEVLYLYDPIDEFVITSIRKYKDFEFKSVDHIDSSKIEQFKNEKEKASKVEELSADDTKQFDSLLAKIKEILGDRVVEVKESRRLSDSAACVVSLDEGFSSSMQKIMRLANKDLGEQKKNFEINKDHKLVRNLLKVFKADSGDEYIKDVVEQLYESALLLEGSLIDPHKLAGRINKMLDQSSDWYASIKKL
jgi:molecular chaperone HtpG